MECISDLKAGVFHIYNFINMINILTADILELDKSSINERVNSASLGGV